jgi:3',5'-cyclic AMP phosphodiesterase CpdA
LIIAHISDLHLNTIFKKENELKTKAIIHHLKQIDIDHLVITCDIADNADKESFVILKDILKENGFYDSHLTSVVIGNHDIFGGVQRAIDIVNFPKKCLETNYDKKVREFISEFEELFVNVDFADENLFFPYAKLVGGVVFIGLNTIARYSKLKNPLASNGKVSSDQLELIQKLCENEKYRPYRKIILSHHHYYKNYQQASSSQNKLWDRIESHTLKLRGKKKLLKLFKKLGINTVFHGHSHENRPYERKGIMCYNAGASIDNNSDDLIYYFLHDFSREEPLSVLNEMKIGEIEFTHSYETA